MTSMKALNALIAANLGDIPQVDIPDSLYESVTDERKDGTAVGRKQAATQSEGLGWTPSILRKPRAPRGSLKRENLEATARRMREAAMNRPGSGGWRTRDKLRAQAAAGGV